MAIEAADIDMIISLRLVYCTLHIIYCHTAHLHLSPHCTQRKLCSNGAIFKGKQEGWYCVSDEAFYSADEVEVIHSSGQVVARESGRPVQWLSEDNYRFRLHEFIEPVQRWLRCAAPIQPASRLHDLQPFLRRIQQEAMELSVSRKRSTVRWGIPVPGDEEDQLIYVWIDALASYLTAAGDASILSETSHVIGKDILK